jgi:hypothetical protein
MHTSKLSKVIVPRINYQGKIVWNIEGIENMDINWGGVKECGFV